LFCFEDTLTILVTIIILSSFLIIHASLLLDSIATDMAGYRLNNQGSIPGSGNLLFSALNPYKFWELPSCIPIEYCGSVLCERVAAWKEQEYENSPQFNSEV
jgi:hypothetical protein